MFNSMSFSFSILIVLNMTVWNIYFMLNDSWVTRMRFTFFSRSLLRKMLYRPLERGRIRWKSSIISRKFSFAYLLKAWRLNMVPVSDFLNM